MFDKEYRFTGKHALYVDRLSSKFEESKSTALFNRNVDIFVIAPLIGFLYNRRADIDNTKDPETGRVYDEHIMGDRMIHSSDDINFDFRLIMLLDEEYEPDKEKRIDKAFKYMGKESSDNERFQMYLRGGIEVLYEKLIENSNDPEDYVNNLYDFVCDFQDMFNKNVDAEQIIQECSK